MKNSVTIIGAGLVGSLMAIYLTRRGYTVSLYEKRPDMRKNKIDGGRSINLALSLRGLWPLEEVGLKDKVQNMMIPMEGRMMHDEESRLTFQPYGKKGQVINSISRGGLNALLMDEAEAQGANIHFGYGLKSIDFDKNHMIFEHDEKEVAVTSDIILGTDGAFSVTRRQMQAQDRFNYSQYFLPHGYKELTIPPGSESKFQIEKYALHIWPRGNYMLIALPNQDGSFTCTLFFPFEGNPSFEALKSDDDIIAFFESHFPDTIDLIPNLVEDFHNNPTASLVTIKCYPWVANKTLILGDASHAIVPFYGQGMNSGFEDCRVLNSLLEEYNDNWTEVLEKFQELRKPDADAISDLAMRNFIEMRDLVADEKFLTQKKIEARLQEKYPDEWIPLYSMVTFSPRLRYSEALKRGEKQDKIMHQVVSKMDNLDNWQEVELEPIIEQLRES